MRIKIKTASKEANLAVIFLLRTELGQIVALTYSAGLFIVLEYIGLNMFSPLFPIDSQSDVDRLLKLNLNEKDILQNVEIEKISEEETYKILSHEMYHIYYKKKDEYFDLIKFESEALEHSSNMFFHNMSPNLLVMQPVDINENFTQDGILERITQVGINNITRFEKAFLQRISNQE